MTLSDRFRDSEQKQQHSGGGRRASTDGRVGVAAKLVRAPSSGGSNNGGRGGRASPAHSSGQHARTPEPRRGRGGAPASPGGRGVGSPSGRGAARGGRGRGAGRGRGGGRGGARVQETPPTAAELDAEMEDYWKNKASPAAAAAEEEGLDLDEAELGDLGEEE
jgi:hypothetical protein